MPHPPMHHNTHTRCSLPHLRLPWCQRNRCPGARQPSDTACAGGWLVCCPSTSNSSTAIGRVKEFVSFRLVTASQMIGLPVGRHFLLCCKWCAAHNMAHDSIPVVNRSCVLNLSPNKQPELPQKLKCQTRTHTYLNEAAHHAADGKVHKVQCDLFHAIHEVGVAICTSLRGKAGWLLIQA